jgi:hypothetical protein
MAVTIIWVDPEPQPGTRRYYPFAAAIPSYAIPWAPISRRDPGPPLAEDEPVQAPRRTLVAALHNAVASSDAAAASDVEAVAVSLSDIAFVASTDATALSDVASDADAAADFDAFAFGECATLTAATPAAESSFFTEEAAVAFADADAGRYDSSPDLGIGTTEASSAEELVAEAGSLTGTVADTLAVQHQVALVLIDAFADAASVAARDAGAPGFGDGEAAAHSLSATLGLGAAESPATTLTPALADRVPVADAARTADAGKLSAALAGAESAGAGVAFASVPGSEPVFTGDLFALAEGWALASALADHVSAAVHEASSSLVDATTAVVAVAAGDRVRLIDANFAADASGASDASPAIADRGSPVRAGDAFAFAEGPVYLASAATAAEHFAAGSLADLAGAATAFEGGRLSERAGPGTALAGADAAGLHDAAGVGLGDFQAVAQAEAGSLSGGVAGGEAAGLVDLLRTLVATVNGYDAAAIGDVHPGFGYVLPVSGPTAFCSATVAPRAFCSETVQPLAYCSADEETS